MSTTRPNFRKPAERAVWLKGPTANCQLEGAAPRRPSHIVLLGPPGVGKGTQADLIVQEIGACHLSTGDIFRAAIAAGIEKATPAMRQALGEMQRGALVPDDLVVEIVRERMRCLTCSQGFLLDGFPRTVKQAEKLDELLEHRRRPLDAVVELSIADELLVRRITGRLFHKQSGRSYHKEFNPPKVSMKDDVTGEPLIQRSDDNEETLRKRLASSWRQSHFNSLAGHVPHADSAASRLLHAPSSALRRRRVAVDQGRQRVHRHHLHTRAAEEGRRAVRVMRSAK